MDLIQFAILVSALLCSLVSGLVLTFAIIVMPGIRAFDDLGYLKAFKVIDRVIQNNQPIFMMVWLGSAVMLMATTVYGLWQLGGVDRLLMIVTCTIFIFGVHVPTMTINVPLNNHLQAQDLDALSDSELSKMAEKFESRWMRWNTIRTVVAITATVLLLVLLARI